MDIPPCAITKALEPAGMCRICTVELFDGRRTRFVTACNYPIWEGMEVTTDSEDVIQGRKLIVELLLARCPEVPCFRNWPRNTASRPRFKLKNDTASSAVCVPGCVKRWAAAPSA
jgi:heterodisulfide reductase subunit A